MKRTRPHRNARPGNAPMETVLFLPLLVVMLAGMVTVTQVSVTDSTAATTARHVAFQARSTPYDDGPLFTAGTTGVGLSAIDDILGPRSSIEPDGGLILSGVELPITAMFDRFKNRLPMARGMCGVVGDTWDHETVRFKRHGRLTLSEKVNYFGGGSIGNLGAFSRFIGRSIASGSFSGSTATASQPTAPSGSSQSGGGLRNVAGRAFQLFIGATEVVGGGAMAIGGGIFSLPTGGGSLLVSAGGVAIMAHGADQIVAAIRGEASLANRATGEIAANVFGEEYRDAGGVIGDFGFGSGGALKGGRAAALLVLRLRYVNAVKGLSKRKGVLRSQGKTSEQIARTLHAERRALGEKFKTLTPPDKLEKIYSRNLKKYGDELGPSIDYLRKQGKTWEDIIESASRPGGKDLRY